MLRAQRARKIFEAGTVRMNRCKKRPLLSEKELTKNGRGWSDSFVSDDGKIVVTRWLENLGVNIASNFIGVEVGETASHWSKVDRCFIDVKRPAVVGAYNRSRGRVDKADFLVQDHNSLQKADSPDDLSFCESGSCKLLVRVQA